MSINQLVKNLLGFGNKLNNDPGLKQGSAFNSMQKQIIDRTLPALPLMEETTMPGLGSIVESLSNQESAESPLKNVDKREFKALQKLETEFNQKLTQYVAAYKAQLQHITSATPESSATPTTGKGYLVAGGNIQGPATTSFEEAVQWCKNNSECGGVPTNQQDATQPIQSPAEIWYKNNQTQYSPSSGWSSYCKKGCGQGSQKPVSTKKTSHLASQVQRLNDELLDISNRMWSHIQKLHTTDEQLQKALTSKRTALRKQMQQLQAHHQHHEQVRTSGSTLEGEIEDRHLQVDSLYLQYLVWFFAASTLAVVAFHQVTKKS